MSKQQLINFITTVKQNNLLKTQLKYAQPEEILRIASEQRFNFSPAIQGKFRNRWVGVYVWPHWEDIHEICPALCPPGFNSLAHYSQSKCSPYDSEENPDYR